MAFSTKVLKMSKRCDKGSTKDKVHHTFLQNAAFMLLQHCGCCCCCNVDALQHFLFHSSCLLYDYNPQNICKDIVSLQHPRTSPVDVRYSCWLYLPLAIGRYPRPGRLGISTRRCTGLGKKVGPRFGCLPPLPGFARSILATWGPPFSRPLCTQNSSQEA